MTRRVAGLVGAMVMVLVAGPIPGAPPARAADPEYTMTTEATYAVNPEARRIAVSVVVVFKNTTPDPPGQFSVFEVVDMAIHDGATTLAVRDGTGALGVTTRRNVNGATVATIRLRTPVRFNQQTAFTVTYLLPDGANADIRVRPVVVVFPAWSFGTGGEVAVTVPTAYEVLVDGDRLTAERDGASWRLASGSIEDPTRWLALVTASRPDSHATLTRGVALASGTVDLQVRHWTDDEAWGQRVMDLFAAALPLLEAEIGMEYDRVGPLVVVESLAMPHGGLEEPIAEGVEIAAAFEEPPFTLLHQAAHVWISERVAAERWIREGFASRAAARVADQLDVDLPFDPEARREELADDAFPLVSWGTGEASVAQESYAYAASWAVADRLAAAVGEEQVREAWRRIAAGIGAYEMVGSGPPDTTGRHVVPVDARRLLDQLEAVSDADLSTMFEQLVLDAAAAGQLPDRAAARQAYAELLAASGALGSPEPIQASMAGWRFDEALDRIAEAHDWLTDRQALLAAAQAAGLAVPDRLRDQFRTAGGGPEARTELDAEMAVVTAYRQVLDRSAADRSPFERIGLLGGEQPADLLAEAKALFAEGDLRGAAESVEAARERMDRAAPEGVVRVVSLVAVALAMIAAAVYLARRRRSGRGSGYTAAP